MLEDLSQSHPRVTHSKCNLRAWLNLSTSGLRHTIALEISLGLHRVYSEHHYLQPRNTGRMPLNTPRPYASAQPSKQPGKTGLC